MEIEIQNAVGLFFPTPYFQQIYFEAVVNAIDAGAKKIEIAIKIRAFSSPDTLKVTITDNGTGFTDDRFDRFRKLLKPQDLYHKGLGRLVYLKYFRQVDVESRYENFVRTFTFSSNFDGKNKIKTLEKSDGDETRLTFRDFAGKSLKAYDDLKPTSIIERLTLEILPRLYEMKKAGSELEIVVSLETQEGNPAQDFYNDTQIFKSDKLPELKEVTIKDDAIDMYEGITMAYRIEKRFGKSSIVTAACVDGRTIPLELIPPDGIPNNYSVTQESHGFES